MVSERKKSPDQKRDKEKSNNDVISEQKSAEPNKGKQRPKNKKKFKSKRESSYYDEDEENYYDEEDESESSTERTKKKSHSKNRTNKIFGNNDVEYELKVDAQNSANSGLTPQQ